MNIIEEKYKWNGSLTSRPLTNYIIIHHRCGNGDAQSIHSQHVNSNKWTGIGYHFYVRKDGTIYRGRPIDSIGAHCSGHNSESIGVCFEGDYSKTQIMPNAQLISGCELIKYIKGIYPNARVKKHSDFMATACPGKYFPFDKITNSLGVKQQEEKQLLTTANDITWELNHSFFPITDTEKFVKALDEAKKNNSSLYWGYYKLVNGIK